MHDTFLSEATSAVEAERGGEDAVPPLIARGGRELGRMSRGVARLVRRHRDRLAGRKESVVALYRARLESHGIDTRVWFEPQLDLAPVGAFPQLGWNRLGGDAAEVGWWERRIDAASHRLGGRGGAPRRRDRTAAPPRRH